VERKKGSDAGKEIQGERRRLQVIMPLSKYTKKQKKLAKVAKPRDKITKADFDKLNKGKKKKK